MVDGKEVVVSRGRERREREREAERLELWEGRGFTTAVTYTKGRRAAVEEALVGILVGFIMCLGWLMNRGGEVGLCCFVLSFCGV